MKKLACAILVALLVILPACKKSTGPVRPLPAGTHAVAVIETIDASNYTYLHVREGNKEYWMAAPQFQAQRGEVLYYKQAMEMKDFESKTLKRTFPSIFFVQDISPDMNNVANNNSPHGALATVKKENIKLEHLRDGKTVAQIYEQKDKLSGQVIKTKGKVTKINTGIMDMNWIHIQDGTGTNETADLLVLSKQNVRKGQIIVVQGTVSVNKNFGAGYIYKALIENGKIIKHI